MNYGQVRDASLKLLHQFSLEDVPIPRTYNEQGDCLRRIPELVDDAMWIIAAGPRRIRAARPLRPERARDRDGMICFALPEDLMEIVPGGLLVVKDGEARHESGYLMPDEGHILLPRVDGALWLEYWRRPRSVAECIAEGETEPRSCAELDNAPETHRAIPYYVAAHLALQDDEGVYLALLKEWRELLRRMPLRPVPHRAIVDDVYDWRGWE